MSAERKRGPRPKERKPTFEESFNILTSKVIDAWADTPVKFIPIFFEGQLGVSDYYRLLTLDRSKSWMRQINDKEVTVTALPNYVLRSYVILTNKELYERASKIEDERSIEAKELNRVASALLENNREELEKEFVSVMKGAIVFAGQWKKARQFKEAQIKRRSSGSRSLGWQ